MGGLFPIFEIWCTLGRHFFWNATKFRFEFRISTVCLDPGTPQDFGCLGREGNLICLKLKLFCPNTCSHWQWSNFIFKCIITPLNAFDLEDMFLWSECLFFGRRCRILTRLMICNGLRWLILLLASQWDFEACLLDFPLRTQKQVLLFSYFYKPISEIPYLRTI